MRAILVLVFAFFSPIIGQESCSVPVVCTRDDGSSFTTWRPMNENPTLPPPTQPATDSSTSESSASSTTTEATANTATMQQLRDRIALLSEPGWFYGENDHQYWISQGGVSVPYENAVQICEAMGSNIVVEGMRNNASRAFILNNILIRCGNIHGWWIGYRDADEDGIYVWNDGQDFAPGDGPNWSDNQPDTNSAQCAVIARYFNYKWDDVSCIKATMGVICERYIGTL